jgi:hypothetical protein
LLEPENVIAIALHQISNEFGRRFEPLHPARMETINAGGVVSDRDLLGLQFLGKPQELKNLNRK